MKLFDKTPFYEEGDGVFVLREMIIFGGRKV
jgi:hypothetical protein